MASFLFDGFYDKLSVRIGGGWIGFSFPMPPTSEETFLRELANRSKTMGFGVGSVGVVGDPEVSVRSDEPVRDALAILGLFNVDIAKVRFSVHCTADKQDHAWEILRLAGVSESCVRFDIIK